jgi:hypothetical protein
MYWPFSLRCPARSPLYDGEQRTAAARDILLPVEVGGDNQIVDVAVGAVIEIAGARDQPQFR